MDRPPISFSVIIPALDEEAVIGECISRVRRIDENVEIIVADGRSADGTTRIAERCGARVCASEPGRGVQCNAGAAAATGDILVFLHADTQLPAGAFDRLEGYFRDAKVNIGTFRLRFDTRHWLLRLYCLPSRFEWAVTRFGDQCIVVRKSFFNAIGGFPGWPLFEDLGFLQKAGKLTRVYRFRAAVTTSARRFLKYGILRQQLRNMWYIFLYLTGTAPEELALRYERQHKAR